MKIALSKREQRVVFSIAGLALLIGWLYTAYIVGPLTREAARLGREVRSARARLASLEAVMTQEPKIRGQFQQWDEKVKVLRSQLPAQEELPAVIELLSDLATESQVKIQAIFPQRSLNEKDDAKSGKSDSADPGVYKDVVIQIDALAGYHQLGTFLSLVESGRRPMRLSSLRMAGDSKDPKRHHVKILIRAYFATDSLASRQS